MKNTFVIGLAVASIAATAHASEQNETAEAVNSSQTHTVTVSQRGRSFDPDEITIQAGDTVMVINDDQFLHHAYIDSPTMQYDSKSQPIGSRIDIVFDHSGEFVVRCDIHPKMRLDVTVEE